MPRYRLWASRVARALHEQADDVGVLLVVDREHVRPDADERVVDDDQRRGGGLRRAAQQRVVDLAACRRRHSVMAPPTSIRVDTRSQYCGKATTTRASTRTHRGDVPRLDQAQQGQPDDQQREGDRRAAREREDDAERDEGRRRRPPSSAGPPGSRR